MDVLTARTDSISCTRDASVKQSHVYAIEMPGKLYSHVKVPKCHAPVVICQARKAILPKCRPYGISETSTLQGQKILCIGSFAPFLSNTKTEPWTIKNLVIPKFTAELLEL
jgi:hypothetical protein